MIDLIWLIVIGILLLVGVMLFNNQEFKDWLKTLKVTKKDTFSKGPKYSKIIALRKLKKQFYSKPSKDLTGLFSTLVGASVVITVGMYVFGQVSKSIGQQLNATNTTSDIYTTTNSAFQLASIAFVVLIAALVISFFVKMFIEKKE